MDERYDERKRGTTIIAPGATLNMNGSASHTVARVLENGGTVNWTESGGLAMNGGTFNNNGSFVANSVSLLDCYSLTGVNVFNNAGTFTKLGTGEARTRNSSTGVSFNNRQCGSAGRHSDHIRRRDK